MFQYTPNPWSAWACLVQLLEFWQISIAVYICLVVAYMRVRALLHNYCGSHPMCYVLSFELVVHAFSIVCMLAAITTRPMMQMLWQRNMHPGLWQVDFLLNAIIPYMAVMQRHGWMSICTLHVESAASCPFALKVLLHTFVRQSILWRKQLSSMPDMFGMFCRLWSIFMRAQTVCFFIIVGSCNQPFGEAGSSGPSAPRESSAVECPADHTQHKAKSVSVPLHIQSV